ILPDAHDGWLVLRGEETPFRDTLIPVKIGDLDPEDTTSGQLARLNNLGYLPGDGTDPDAFRSAVEEFQCDHPPLKVDGTCGKKTEEQLKMVHGCGAEQAGRLAGRSSRMAGAKSGVVRAVSEGGVAGAHHPAGPFEFVVGPTTTDQLNTAHLPLIPIACFRVD